MPDMVSKEICHGFCLEFSGRTHLRRSFNPQVLQCCDLLLYAPDFPSFF